MSEYSILSLTNYRENVDETDINDILKKYIDLQQEFLLYLQKHIIIQNQDYYNFIIKRGLDTIKHIFNNLILYTKNIDLTMHHCKKVFVYYIEFVEQIVNEQHYYLQLNSKDAILFIYKKTIFDINNEHRKKFKLSMGEQKLIKNLNIMQNLFDELLKYTVDTDGENLKLGNDDFLTNITLIINTLNNILKHQTFDLDETTFNKYIDPLVYFISYVFAQNIDCNKILRIIQQISKKMFSKKLSLDIINKKTNDKKSKLNLKSMTPLKYSNWLYS